MPDDRVLTDAELIREVVRRCQLGRAFETDLREAIRKGDMGFSVREHMEDD